MTLKNKKTVSAIELENWCNELLKTDEFKDYAPNGLQIDADHPIGNIITGVTANEALIDAAIQQKANAIIVHHGYFWKGEDPRLISMKGKRIKKLLQNNISLFAYHLPLDAHPSVGNNKQLGDLLDLTDIRPLFPKDKHSIGNIFTSISAMTPKELADKITLKLGRAPLHISGGLSKINKIGICTGAAQDMIEQAYKMGCDAFISGEISERTTHTARELEIDYFACGHHATEKGGIQALTRLIQQQSSLNISFIDIDNPV